MGDSKQHHDSVISRFMDVVRAFPDRVAISDGKDSLTYAEIDMRSQNLSRTLVGFGVRPEFVVGVSLKSTIELIVCILAIWRAGGAYLPLDPEYPKKRLRYMLTDSGCRLVLATSKASEAFQGLEITTWITDPNIGSESNFLDDCTYLADNSVSDLAYVVYTSGSTGEPKGVEGTHRSLINRLDWGLQTFPVASSEICCLKTSISFLDSLSEMLTPLLGGCLLKIAPDHLIKDQNALVDFLRDECVTRFVAVPSLLRLICAVLAERGETLPCMTIVVSSGEALLSETVVAVFLAMPNTRIINLYGSSEIGADVTFNVLSQPSEVGGDISIGSPLADAVCVVLDEAGKPVDDDVCGELYVGGVCLARGYRNREQETRARFIKPSAELGLSCDRLFRTGDMVKRRPDGSFSFLGRIDDQIKIGGVRIELAEIERAVSSLDLVSEAAVAALEREHGDRYLAAFIVLNDPNGEGRLAARIAQLKSDLVAILPPKMIPTHFEVIAALPLNPNGKLDRRALRPGLGWIPSVAVSHNVRSSTLEKLAQVWADVLNLEPEGLQAGSDFHLLGGNSFALLKLVFRCSRIWEHPLDIPRFLANPTLAAMADQLERRKSTKTNPHSFLGDVVSAPLSPSQSRLLDGIEISDPRICHHNIEFLYKVETKIEALGAALSRFLGRHDVFRISKIYRDADGQLIQKFNSSAPEFSTIRLEKDTSFDDFLRDVKTCRDAIDPHNGRLYHFQMRSDPTGTTYLYGLINHLIFDGYSQFLMLSELSCFIRDPEISLAAPLGFGVRSKAYREDRARDSFAAEVPYWASIVGNVPDRGALSDTSGEGRSVLRTTVCVLSDKRCVLKERNEWFRSNVALALCAFAVGQYFKRRDLDVRVVGSNRLALDGVDDSLTVGYVSDHYPQKLVVSETLPETVSNVLEMRSAVPRGGAGYPWLRHGFNVPELVNGAQIDDFPMHFNFLPQSDEFALFTDCTELLGAPDPFQGDDDYQGIAFFVVEENGCFRIGVYRNNRFVSDEAVDAIVKTLKTSFENLAEINGFPSDRSRTVNETRQERNSTKIREF